MNLKQMAHFLKLKKAYAYDIALSKPELGQIAENDMYESLCLLDLSHQLTDTLNQFMDEYESTHEGEEVVCVLTSVAYLLSGVIRMETQNKEDGEDMKYLFDSIYQSISKEKSDEN